MVEPVMRVDAANPTRCSAASATVLLGMLVALTLSAGAFAETLTDPTRPPAAFIHASASAPAAGLAVASPVLQSVMISSQRRVATISGQVVMVGDKVGEATVARIGENEVVLRRGKALETLKLFPVADKREGTGKTMAMRPGFDRKE